MLWARINSRIHFKLFFQSAGIFLILFTAYICIHALHELSEAGVLPNSEVFHLATEPYSPDGIYGKWFGLTAVAACALWLVSAWVKNKLDGNKD